MSADLQAAAIEAAKLGLKVFPLRPRSKEPRMEGGFKSATNDPGFVGGLWAQWPDANIGLDLPPGVVVVDIDAEEGIERVRDLDLPNASTVVRTARGWQGFYRLPEGRVVRQGPLDNIGDLKVGGSGYTILPPSVHPSGAVYSFAKGSLQGILDPPRLTEAHVEAIELLRGGTTSTGPAPVLPDAIPAGQRNATLASLAGSMRKRGASPEAILAALKIENETRCNPPLDADEVERIAKSIARYEPAAEKLSLAVADVPTLGAVPTYPVEALPDPARLLVERGARDGLPTALVGGAALAAMAAAIGSRSTLNVTPTWRARPILWVVLLAPRGAGKSPAQDNALSPIRDYDAQLFESDSEYADPPVRVGDSTFEALARNLAEQLALLFRRRVLGRPEPEGAPPTRRPRGWRDQPCDLRPRRQLSRLGRSRARRGPSERSNQCVAAVLIPRSGSRTRSWSRCVSM